MEIYGSEITQNIIDINNQRDILDLLLKNFNDYIKLTQEQKIQHFIKYLIISKLDYVLYFLFMDI